MSRLININFSKIGPEQKQTNVGHSETDEIINGNSQNIGCDIKKASASAFERKSKAVYDLIQKNYEDRFLKSTKFSG